jgi:23S rRNA (uracil1939-C5)-methyltransferase
MSRHRKPKYPAEPLTLSIDNLSHEGRGIARLDGKTAFVHGALPGEHVIARCRAAKKNYLEAVTEKVITASPLRVEPGCPHFGLCGGCSLQHMDSVAQREHKQNTLLEQLQHIGQVTPKHILEPLIGPEWGYRRRARLGVKYVQKKASLLIGFREKSSPFLADMSVCKVLHPSVGEKIMALRDSIGSLASHDKIAQIEVAVGDNATVLTLRNLVELSAADLDKLRDCARQHAFHIYLQPGGIDTIAPLWPEQPEELYYQIAGERPRQDSNDSAAESRASKDFRIYFQPLDFIQINADLNQKMIPHALALLDPQPQDSVLELFSGLGNFTLPLASRVAEVVAVEGEESLVERAKMNAQRNDVHNIQHYAANLAEVRDAPWLRDGYNKILLDPPRTGALEIIRQLPLKSVQRLVYVSCNPATLARDAHELAQQGFKLRAAGIMDMFPHTAHVESIGVFE